MSLVLLFLFCLRLLKGPHPFCGDATQRYGNLHKGAADIMEHKYFDTVDWNMARKKYDTIFMS